MATPRRNTVDYFPHLIGYGKKMDFIEKRHGNDGYATWFKILEALATTDNHYLNLNDDIEVSFLASRCNVDENKLSTIIDDLVKIRVFDSDLWKYKVLWSKSFFDNIQDAYKRRATKPLNLHTLCIHLVNTHVLPADFAHTSCKQKTAQKVDDVRKSPYIILEDSIVEDSIESDSTRKQEKSQFSHFGKQPIDDLKKNCATHSSWLEMIAMKNSISREDVSLWFDAFCLHLGAIGKTEETEKEFKRYCATWIASELRQGRKPLNENKAVSQQKVSATEAMQQSLIKKYGKHV